MQKNHIISYAQEWKSHEKLYMNTDKVYKLDLLVTLYCKKSWETGLCSRSAGAPQRTNFLPLAEKFYFFLTLVWNLWAPHNFSWTTTLGKNVCVLWKHII